MSRKERDNGNRKPDRRISPRMAVFAGFSALLVLLFAVPITRAVRYALAQDMYSHALLVPFISAYLAFRLRHTLKPVEQKRSYLVPLGFLLGALALMGTRFWLQQNGTPATVNDDLALTMSAFLCLFWGGAVLTLGTHGFRVMLFPFAFLIFIIPLPDAAADVITRILQLGSADAFGLLLRLFNIPFIRIGTTFILPWITMNVAPECSGIRSSLVLVITAVLAGHLYLRTKTGRSALILLSLPLGIVRNAVRIMTLAVLTKYWGPVALTWWIHRSGGPLFFAFSLGVLLLLLLVLSWAERRVQRSRRRKDVDGADSDKRRSE